MAIVREQFKSGSVVGGSPVAITLNAATKLHSALLVVYRCFYSSTPYTTLADNKGSTFGAPDNASPGTDGTLLVAAAYDIAGSGGVANHTVTVTLASQYYIVTVIEVSGLALSAAFDKTHGATSLNSYSSGDLSVATSVADEYLLGAHGGYPLVTPTTAVPATGWTQVDYATDSTFHQLLTQDRIVSSTNTYRSDGTAQSFHNNLIMTYKGATGGPTPTLTRNSSLSGLGSSGPFFHDPLSSKGFARRDRIFVPARMAA